MSQGVYTETKVPKMGAPKVIVIFRPLALLNS